MSKRKDRWMTIRMDKSSKSSTLDFLSKKKKHNFTEVINSLKQIKKD
jgi:hypothetical protein